MHVVVFEGTRWPRFAPLSLSQPVFNLLVGTSTLLEKQIRHLCPTRLTLWVRPGLAEYVRQFIVPLLSVPTQVNTPLDEEPALLCSGRTLHISHFEPLTAPTVVVDEDTMVRFAYLRSPGLSPQDCTQNSPAWQRLLELPQGMSQGRRPDYLWDLLKWNDEAIVADAVHLKKHPQVPAACPYCLVNPENIYIDPQAKLSPGVVIDADKGPVIIDAKAVIGANAVLHGPCYIGKYSQISPLAVIREGVSIGPQCKIGGEVYNSIILGLSNKPHDGFLGDSYVGQWVNLGAGATTSNLKNTYGHVKMHIGAQQIDSGLQFLGAMIGDHVKAGIGTRLMTGSYVGYGSMISTSALPPKFIPSFTFLTDKGAEPYRLEKVAEVQRQMFARRGREWSESDDAMLHYVAATSVAIEQ